MDQSCSLEAAMLGGREEGVVSSLNSHAWEYCGLHMTGGRGKSSEQKKEKQDDTEITVDFYCLRLQNQG